MSNTSKKFEIEVLHGQTVQRVRISPVKDDAGKTISFEREEFEETLDTSYMVYFPQGHSVHFTSKADMARAGILPHDDTEIDLDTGLPVVPPAQRSIKAVVKSKTRDSGVRAVR